jgi:hypothetical protein
MLQDRYTPVNVTLESYNRYRTTYPDIEIIGGMLWDTVQYTSAASLRLTFFNAVRATPDLSNMDTPSMLSNNKGFLIRALRFKVLQQTRAVARAADGAVQPGAFDNIAQILNTGFFRLVIGSKPYAELPLWMIPGGDGALGHLATDGDIPTTGVVVDYATNGVPSPDNVLVLSQPLFIAPLVNFYVEILWAAAITLAGGNTNVQVLFDGDLMRPVQ